MTQVKLVKLKLIEGNERTWLEWCEELKQRKDEVIQTLQNENVLSEACFLDEEERCIYYFMEAEDFTKAHEAFKESTYKID